MTAITVAAVGDVHIGAESAGRLRPTLRGLPQRADLLLLAGDLTRLLEETGIRVLEGNGVELDFEHCRVGIAGVKGFGGGFAGKCGSAFGEPEMKAFIAHTVATADALNRALGELRCDITIALTHYSPVPQTLRGEPPEIYPFLGSYQLAEAIDAHGTDLAVHGHAHYGREHGVTPGGVRVRNVAQPVINAAYACYQLAPAHSNAGQPQR